jgi:hypothetical protein
VFHVLTRHTPGVTKVILEGRAVSATTGAHATKRPMSICMSIQYLVYIFGI